MSNKLFFLLTSAAVLASLYLDKCKIYISEPELLPLPSALGPLQQLISSHHLQTPMTRGDSGLPTPEALQFKDSAPVTASPLILMSHTGSTDKSPWGHFQNTSPIRRASLLFPCVGTASLHTTQCTVAASV